MDQKGHDDFVDERDNRNNQMAIVMGIMALAHTVVVLVTCAGLLWLAATTPQNHGGVWGF